MENIFDKYRAIGLYHQEIRRDGLDSGFRKLKN